MKDLPVLRLMIPGLFCLISGLTLCSHAVGHDPDERLTVNDDDTVYLQRYQNTMMPHIGTTGAVYNALNPKYILNPHGATVLRRDRRETVKVFDIAGLDVPHYYFNAVNAARTR